MGNGGQINLNPATLVRAGQSMNSASAGSAKANPHGDLDEVSAALPGSFTAATAATALDNAWNTQFAHWTEQAKRCGDGMVKIAHNYHGTDNEAAHHGHGLQKAVQGGHDHPAHAANVAYLKNRLG